MSTISTLGSPGSDPQPGFVARLNALCASWGFKPSSAAPAHAADGPATDAGVGSPTPEVAVGDLHNLCTAVTARLRQTVTERAAPSPMAPAAFLQVQTAVLDCASALDQVHAVLAQELTRCRQLDQEMRTTQAALAQARAELAGTRAGELQARHLALHDSLTGLPNRRYFREGLQRALDQAGPHRQLALLYLDLDGFKAVNDTHGHAIGDALLCIVAARLARTVRAEDMMSRMGGDEFGCLITGWPERARLVQLVGKLVDAVSAPSTYGRLRLRVQPSIGIALYPGDGENAEELLHNADAAMYRAKRQRSGHAFFQAQAPT